MRRLGRALVVLGVLSAALLAAAPASAAPPPTITQTFAFSGVTESWTVPADVTSATFELFGAQGGLSYTGVPGGRGARAMGTFDVTPFTTLAIVVGEMGRRGGAGAHQPTFGGGGRGGIGGGLEHLSGSGGGASRAGGLLVAGGGGGGGAPGEAGGTPGITGGNGGSGGASGTAGNPGADASNGPTGGQPGASGGAASGGAGGAPGTGLSGSGTAGQPGTSGAGGDGGAGAFSSVLGGTGGGGGGGYFGGGGGGGGGAYNVSGVIGSGGGGGGGGGSSFRAPGATGDLVDEDERAGNGLAVVSYLQPPQNSQLPEVTGTPRVGSTVTCQPGSWTQAPTFTYQWLLDGATIAGAIGGTYQVLPGDSGHALACRVTATNLPVRAIRTTASVRALPLEPPVSTSPPQITGTPAAGQTLSCAPGTWSGGPTFAYAWLRNGAPIAGAGSAQYAVTETDEGTVLQCRVTATNGGGAVVADSAAVLVPTPPVDPPVVPPPPPLPPSNAAPPGIVGRAAVGASLGCTPGAWTGGPRFSYAWLRNGVPIAGATGQVYAVSESDSLAALQCVVTARNAVGGVAALSVAVVVRPVAHPAQLIDVTARVDRKGRTRLRVSCPSAAGSCEVRLSLIVPGPVRLGRRTLRNVAVASAAEDVQGGDRESFPMRLSSSGRALLTRKRRLAAQVRLVSDEDSGLRSRGSVKIVLRR